MCDKVSYIAVPGIFPSAAFDLGHMTSCVFLVLVRSSPLQWQHPSAQFEASVLDLLPGASSYLRCCLLVCCQRCCPTIANKFHATKIAPTIATKLHLPLLHLPLLPYHYHIVQSIVYHGCCRSTIAAAALPLLLLVLLPIILLQFWLSCSLAHPQFDAKLRHSSDTSSIMSSRWSKTAGSKSAGEVVRDMEIDDPFASMASPVARPAATGGYKNGDGDRKEKQQLQQRKQ